jgi:hypothetical protein
MIYWFDSFMAIFGFKRPEVWQAERKEHDVTFPAPQEFKKPRKRSNVRSKKAGKRSQSAEGLSNVRSKPLTLSELRKDSGKCHAIYQMVDAFTDEQIAKEIGATVRAVQDYRLLVGWRRR